MKGVKNKYRRSDRLAIIVLIVVALSTVLVFTLLSDKSDADVPTASQEKGEVRDKYYAQEDIGYGDGSKASDAYGELFPFDPNTADSTQLLRLGLQPWQVRNIYKYRAHGGRYRTPEDFGRLYGLTMKQYNRLRPYIRIAQEPMARDVLAARSADAKPTAAPHDGNRVGQSYDGKPYVRIEKLKPGQKVDINTADTMDLMRIPGIGEYFARRIIELRSRRKAFVSTDEVLSIVNMPETALAYMTASATFPMIHINSMSQKEMQHHPLLNYLQARDIVALRRTMGEIRSFKDISALPSFSPEQMKRITPFVSFD